jgi:hypothetical protein
LPTLSRQWLAISNSSTFIGGVKLGLKKLSNYSSNSNKLDCFFSQEKSKKQTIQLFRLKNELFKYTGSPDEEVEEEA